MLHIVNSRIDPDFNLALEEYFLKYSPIADDLIILWRNVPTVVIGRNQNAAAELNQPFIIEQHIQVVRRLSLLKAIFQHAGTSYHSYELSAADHQSIESLARSRYQDPVWNYGTLPPYNRSIKQKFAGGTIQVLLNVQEEIILHAALYGDFFATGNIDELAAKLCGTAFTRESVDTILISWLSKHPIHNISPDDLLSCFFPNL